MNFKSFLILFLIASSSWAVDFGELVQPSDPVFNNIVGVINTRRRTVCSGIAIRKDIILTAAHCVSGYPDMLAYQGARMPIGNMDPIKAGAIPVIAGYVTSGAEAGDLAMLYLAQALPLPIKPIHFDTKTPFNQLMNKKVTFYGYGYNLSFEKETPKPTTLKGIGVLRKQIVTIFKGQENNHYLAIERKMLPGVTGPVPNLEMYNEDERDDVLSQYTSGLRSGDSGGAAVVYENGAITLYMNLIFTAMQEIPAGIEVFNHLPAYIKWMQDWHSFREPNTPLVFVP